MPAFDIVSTTAYLKGDSLALTLDGTKRFPTQKRLIAFAHMHCNLLPARAKLILEEVGNAVDQTLAGVQRHISDYPDFKPVGEAMLSEWNEGHTILK
ncbi:MAG: hypothetical protein NT163_10990 [Chlorobiales bacterium]|nr:hypothetical protein [Chlorobiales bacterium]